MSTQTLTFLFGLSVLMALGFLVVAVRAYKKRADHVPTGGAGNTEARRQGGGFRRLGAILRPGDQAGITLLKNRLAQAGLTGRDAVELYLAVRLTSIVGGLVLFFVTASMIDSLIMAVWLFAILLVLSVLGPSFWLDSRASRRRLAISRSLPDTLDLIVTCLDAGLNLEQALARVSGDRRYGHDLLAEAMQVTLEEIRAGLSVSVAFSRLSGRLGHEDVRNLSALIAQASALGANLADALRAHADTQRKNRMVFLEEQAGKANAKLTLPLALCLLPSVLCLLLGPAALMIMRAF